MKGAVAAGSPDTAAVVGEILRQGGNAVDAAVAGTFASFVAEAGLANIGGGGIAQVYDPETGTTSVYDFFSNMPGLGGNEVSLQGPTFDFRKITIDFGDATQAFYIGRASVAVPGVVAGLCKMAQDLGKLPLMSLLEPVIEMARKGVILSENHAYILSLLRPILTDTAEVARLYAPDGDFVQAGDRVRFPAFADTLEALGRKGADLFYSGALARAILDDQGKNGGLLTSRDLAAYQVRKQSPISIPYRGYQVQLPPPSSTGGVLIGFALKLLSTHPLVDLQHNGYNHIRTLAEVMRLTNHARAFWEKNKGEPGAIERFLNGSLFQETARKLEMALNGQGTSLEEEVYHDPRNTTHVSVADSTGLLVGITTSCGENAGFLVGNSGVMLNNMLGEIDLHPNGFHQAQPGERLSTMMSPTLVLQDGQPLLAVGSGGSNRLRTAILQVLSNILDFRLPLQEAIKAPRVHYEDGWLQLEGGIDPDVAAQLARSGARVNLWRDCNMFFGGTHTVAWRDGSWEAAGDPRRGGSTLIVENGTHPG